MLVMAPLIAGGAPPVAGRRPVRIDEARALVLRALKGSPAIRLRGFALEDIEGSSNKQFYVFEGQWNNPDAGSIVAGHYAVDAKTGDVWNALACEEFTSHELGKLQATIRKRIGLSDEEYRQLRRPGPGC